MNCGTLTALVGPNGAGKSSILKALELFYEPKARVVVEDFFHGDVSRPIEIEVTYRGLSEAAQDIFRDYVHEGKLTVARVIQWQDANPSSAYFGQRKQIPQFKQIRETGPAADAKAIYEELRKEEPFKELTKWTNRQAVTDSLKEFEAAHPDICVRSGDDGSFVGFGRTATGDLARFTRFLLLPAVRDASVEGAEGRGTPITELMELVVRDALREKKELRDLERRTEEELSRLLNSSELTELLHLEQELDRTIKEYAPGTGVAIGWTGPIPVELPMPTASVRLNEGGFSATIGRTGHGLQRAFLLVLLQRLAEVRATGAVHEENGGATDTPSVILAIEEPELYQHPSRQRHLASVFGELSDVTEDGRPSGLQVMYCTHSPLFVGLERFDAVRRITKPDAGEDEQSASSVFSFGLGDLARQLWDAAGQPQPEFTADSVRPRLQAILTPWMNEGFFARVVVLVEGEDDRAALLACAGDRALKLDALGIAVIPAMGKPSLDRPLCIFRGMGIPTYVVWDGDADGQPGNQHPEANRALLHHVGGKVEDFPSAVEEGYACFRDKLETTLASELSEDRFERLLGQLQQETGITKRHHALKNPWILKELLARARGEGAVATTINSILDKVLALHGRSSS